jgi:hypothetical protein
MVSKIRPLGCPGSRSWLRYAQAGPSLPSPLVDSELRLLLEIRSAERIPAQRIALHVSNLGHVADGEPATFVGGEQPSFIEDPSDLLLLQRAAGSLADAPRRYVDGIVVVPGHGFAIVEVGSCRSSRRQARWA